MFKRRWMLTAIVACVVALIVTTAAQACPTCKDGIAEGSNHANVIRGYFWSILFMMSMPFLIFGGLGTYFYLQVRRARQAQAAVALSSAEGGDATAVLESSGFHS